MQNKKRGRPGNEATGKTERSIGIVAENRLSFLWGGYAPGPLVADLCYACTECTLLILATPLDLVPDPWWL